jgi:pyrroline-5-carboxylate reductase
MRYTLGFIGAGNMAEAIARAAIDKRIVPAERMIAADPAPQRREVFAKLGIGVADNNADVIAASGQIMLAIKPQMLATLGPELRAIDPAQQIVISIMAGVTAARITEAVGRPARIIRVMPNTPLLVGCGMAGICRGEHAREGDEQLVLQLLRAAGSAVVVDEKLMDAVTAVSGSGPAYVFYLAEAMEKAAAQLGLGPHARVLAARTILGAAMMLVQDDADPADLRRRVTSPGGTTEAAISHLDGNKTTDVFINAIRAAERRGRELGA